ncbi:DUF6883 domain-containing protein [Runella sp.]|uniref:DUF6883 domain-containing protein n=1 Tax=Runella sp. TaxID=1960881 RepID=UPI003D0D6D31
MDDELLENIIVPKDKLTRYLLIHKDKNDKSKFLEQAGYTIENWEILESDLRLLFRSGMIIFEEANEYGRSYSVIGSLTGPNGQILKVKTIWMYEMRNGQTKFITLFPDKK